MADSPQMTIADFFEDARQRMNAQFPEMTSIKVKICGKIIRCVFQKECYASMARYNLPAMPDVPGSPADATFTWVCDSIFSYLPFKVESEKYAVFRYESDETGMVSVQGTQVLAADYVHQKYYIIDHPVSTRFWAVGVHPFSRLISVWAQYCSHLMLHAASVGAGGEGVLLVGRGGCGKSTLAVSSFLYGLDFVSDDYCLISGEGEITSHPIYTNMAVNQDMLLKMPQLHMFQILPMQYDKPSFHISGDFLTKELKIRALIFPEIGGTEPQIVEVSPGKALCQSVHSTVKQLGVLHDTELIKKLSARLSKLPVYKFTVTPDLKTNTDYLKKWIGDLKNV